METILLVVHVLLGASVIGLVLIQQGKGADAGASFGGGNAFQSNQAAAQIIERFGLEGAASGTILGVVFAVLVYFQNFFICQ